MSFERIPFTDRATWLAMRQNDVTASVAGALLGVHEYETAYFLWAVKTGRLAKSNEETAPMRRGRLLERVALDMLAEDRPDWQRVYGELDGATYWRDPVARLGATPDALRIDPSRHGFGVVQIKSVESSVFRKKWKDPDTGEVTPPLWIAVQAIIEAELTGASWACVTPLVIGFGIEMPVIDIPLNRGIVAKVRAATARFWELCASGKEPDPDYYRDAATIAALYADDDGATVDLSGDERLAVILGEREALKAREADGSKAEKLRKVLDAEILHRLGNATFGQVGDGRIIRAATVRRAGFEVKPSQFRTITVKEEKAL